MRRSGTGILWVGLFLLSPDAIFGLPPTENAHGVIVKYKNASKTSFTKRNQLNSQLKTSLVYRPRRSSYDFVLPTDADKQHDFTALASLCKSFENSPQVADCEVNYNLFARADDDTAASVADSIPLPTSCPLNADYGTPTLRDGTLSPFWAQEMTGADLAAFPKNATRMGVAVKVAVIDQGFGENPAMKKKWVAPVLPGQEGMDTHGALILGLLTGPVPYTLQAPLEVTNLYEVRSTVDYLKILDAVEEAKQVPAVIQIAVGLGYSSGAAYEAITRLSKKTILVAAAGNDWPAVMDRNDKEFPGILVGSVSPDGYPSFTSSSGPNVTIGAPSDQYLQSSIDGKNPQTLGGTSGASAMVASVIAAAKSMVPDLTTDEVKTMLQKTAIPTPSGGKNNGAGSLNAMQFLAVADRIRAQNLSGKQREKALDGGGRARLYFFEKDAEAEFAKANAVLSGTGTSCDQRKMAFAQMRRAFFLSPRGPARAALGKALLDQGLKSNARFVGSLDKETMMKQLAEDILSSDAATRIAAARAAGNMGLEGMNMLMQFAENAPRSPASNGVREIAVPAALKGIAASLDDSDRRNLGNRLKASSRDELHSIGEELSN